MPTDVKTPPVPLRTWANTNKTGQKSNLSSGYWPQVMFVLHKIAPLFVTDDYDKIQDEHLTVIGTHKSQSTLLPVYRITLDDGTKITMRYNFFNWMVSVDSPYAVAADFMDIFDRTEVYSHHYCEGFAREDVYGAYQDNNKQFTIQIQSDLLLHLFFYIYTRRVLGVAYR